MQNIDKEDVQLLADIGLLALSYGKLETAETIFKGVQAARPANEAGPLGLALANLARGDVAAAVETLRKLPPSDPVQLYLGIALLRSGDKRAAEEIFSDLIKTAGGTAYGDIAAAHIQLIQKS
jgi:hypothetical protein